MTEGVVFTAVTEEPAPAYAAQPAPEAPRLDAVGEVYQAVVLGLRDYVRKSRMSSVVLGLSGGIDSALVAAIACDAVGPANVVAVSMPSEYSSEHSKDDAADLAKRTGLDYRVQPIKPMVEAFLSQLGLTGIAEENLQARCRGVILMGLSNQEGHLTLATGNKSEAATGYSTIYGDSVGGYAPLKDVPKTLVWEKAASWRNAEAERVGHAPPIPPNSITKPPSAEVAPRPGRPVPAALRGARRDPRGSTSPGPRAGPSSSQRGFDEAVVDKVVSLVDRAEKRLGSPPAQISALASGATGGCRSRAGGASRTPDGRRTRHPRITEV